MATRSRQRALDGLRASLARDGVAGVAWTELEPDLARHPELAHAAQTAARLEGFVPLDDPGRLLGLFWHVLERGVWAEATAFSVRPVPHLKAFAWSVDLVFYDPGRVFRSEIVRRAIPRTGRDAQRSEVFKAILQAIEASAKDLSDEDREAFETGLGRYLEPGISSDDAERVGGFEDGLDEALRPVVLDLRFFLQLPRNQRRFLERVDEWIENERVGPDGRLRGRRISPPVAPAFSSIWGSEDLRELSSGAPPPPPDPAALYAVLADERQPEGRRYDALHALEAIDRDDARELLVRAAGHRALRLNALHGALRAPAFRPVAIEMILCEDPARVDWAMDLLKDLPPDEAWRVSDGADGGRAELGALDQEALLSRFAAHGDASVAPRLVQELERGARSEIWLEHAIDALRELRFAAAAPTVLRYADHESSLLRDAALRFFEIADHPPAVPKLLAALRDERMSAVSAAESGLAGQASAGWKLLLDALEAIHKRALAIPAKSSDDLYRNWLGLSLLKALAGLQGKCPRPEAVKRVLRRVGEDRAPEARRLVGGTTTRRKAPKGEADVGGRTPEETLEKRMELWRAPGYAMERYAAEGHRDGAWNDLVALGHGLYDPRKERQEPDVRRAYEEAVRRGCEDGIVHYRLAVCHSLDRREESAVASFRRAAELIPRRYAACPYALAAAEYAGRAAEAAGRVEEALEFYRRSVGPDMAPRGVREKIASLEAETRLLKAKDPAMTELGRLLRVPGRRHPARVTSLGISPDGLWVVTADEAGHLQVSTVVPDASPDLDPNVRERRHQGRGLACWLSAEDRTFASAGDDGAVHVCAFLPGLPFLGRATHLHGRPITALARLGDAELAFADADGGLFALAVGKEPLPVRREAAGPVRRLLSDGRRLVAVGERHLQAWQLPEFRPLWSRELPHGVLFADLSDALFLGLASGTLQMVDADTGAVEEETPLGPDVFLARFGVDHGAVAWGIRGSGIRVETRREGGGLHLLAEGIDAFDVAFEGRIVVYADRHGWLKAARYGG